MNTPREPPRVRARGSLQATLDVLEAIYGELQAEDAAALAAIRGSLQVASRALERAREILERIGSEST